MKTTPRCLHAFRKFSLAALLAAGLANPPFAASGATLYTWTGQFSRLWGNGNSWQFTPVPEPGTCALLGFGALAGWLAARRPRRR